MRLKTTLLAGFAVATLAIPALAQPAPPAAAQSQSMTREDESKSAEGAITEHSLTFKGHKYAKHAKIKLATARATALAARPGTITDQELEKENGGSGLRYSFDIKSGGKVYEVGIDAKTGKILENDAEGANPD